MQCPVCDVPMFVLEFEMVEIDYCPDCGGVWLDSGELELIGERAGALRDEFLKALERGEGKTGVGPPRRCPICAKKMARLETSGEAGVTLDVCGHRHGIWFDRGELRGVVEAAGAEEDNLLARFFSELDRPTEEAETTAEETNE
ncbi:MAG: zf-TFIIB domain-containing protein [Candidatus Brocadiia bacterium]